MQWQPINDLPTDWQKWANPELPPLVTVWNEQADRLRDSGEFKTYMEKLRREIAIETGIIERLYTLDRGVTRLLIEQGINESLIPHGSTDRPVAQVIALIQDQKAAMESLFDFVGRTRSLSTFYVKQLHQLLTQNQDSTEALVPSTGQVINVPLIRGDWKKQANNPMRGDGSIHEYCPPEQVASEMDRLIELHHQHNHKKIPPEIKSAWLHHRFTQIHPCQDGNGRVARCLGNLVFIQVGWFPLVITRDDRAIYIQASEKADRGDLSDLINLFAKNQKRAFIRSLGLSEQILSESRRTQIVIASIADKLNQNQSITIQNRCHQVEGFAKDLYDLALQRLEEVIAEIKLSLSNLLDEFQVFTVTPKSDGSQSHYHRYQIVETAKQLDYFANLRSYHQWIQLIIDVQYPTIILLSFHVLGHEYRGLLVCSACAYHRDDSGNGESNTNDIQTLSESPFQFSYADEKTALIERFKVWLEEIIVNGLEYWNKSI
ncbi:MAG: Fic family protein [Pleurocapsa minor HA4230-MV1]|jgi:Fic family protein|nr:Fic family protein [Pleurocapsa minor HA4230-MV1]